MSLIPSSYDDPSLSGYAWFSPIRMNQQQGNPLVRELQVQQQRSQSFNRSSGFKRLSQSQLPRFRSTPMPPGVNLSSFSDSGVLGDKKTTFSSVTLIGQTSANVIVRLKGTGLVTTADSKGKFLFNNIPLAAGKNEFTVVAGKSARSKSVFNTAIWRVTEDRVSPVVEWNAHALRAVQLEGTPPPVVARNLAIVHTAIYDAVNSIADRYKAYRVNLDAPTGTSPEAAAVTAAYETLAKLYPTQKATFDSLFANSLAKIPDGQSKTDGIAIGRSVAAALLDWRETDGAKQTVAYTPRIEPGQWRPTAPDFKPASLPHWGSVTPFTMTDRAQFRPAPPPAITSEQCAKELQEVMVLGRLRSRRRTAEQTEIAKFWEDGAGTFTPPGHWNHIAGKISAKQSGSLLDDARTFALLNLGLADAGIAGWDAKYAYNSWRPIDAIRLANTDGNPRTKAIPGWNPLIKTPNHPDYVSGHSTFSGAAAQMLTSLFGNRYRFKSESIGFPGVTRTFENFRQAASEAGISRIYGGIHTASANKAGQKIGRSLATYILNHFITPL